MCMFILSYTKFSKFFMLSASDKSYPTPLKQYHLNLVPQATTEDGLGQLAMETPFGVHAPLPPACPCTHSKTTSRVRYADSGAREHGKVKLTTIIPTERKQSHAASN